MDFDRTSSFMDDPEDFNLDEELFADEVDGANLGNIFDDSENGLITTPLAIDIEFEENDDENSNANTSLDEKARGEEKLGLPKKKKRRSSSFSIEGDRCAGAPPAWHNEVADKQHRENMMREIAQLLRARKKTTPSKEWMKQLPHKARVLEDRLYKRAPSIDAYLNRSTLKNRLKRLAVTITAHYQQMSKPRKNSESCCQSNNSSNANAIFSGMETPKSTKPENSTQISSVDSHILQSLQPPMSVPSSETKQLDVAALPPDEALSELARQKAVNESLQKQILENIRQQQQLVQSIGAAGTGSRSSNVSSGQINSTDRATQRHNNLGPLNSLDNQQSNMQNNSRVNTMQNMNHQMPSTPGNTMNGTQGNQFSNMQGSDNMMANHRNPQFPGMGNMTAQNVLMRHPSASDIVMPSFVQAQSAMMRPLPNGMNTQNAAAMRGDGTAGNGISPAQQQAFMQQMSNTNSQNQAAAFAQIQSAMMGQGCIGDDHHLNETQMMAAMMRQDSRPNQQMSPQAAAHAQAAMMRQLSGSNQFGRSTNAANALQAEMMRRASMNNGFHSSGSPPSSSSIMNQQINQNNTASIFPNGQLHAQFRQANPMMLRQMNAAGMQQQNMNMNQQMQQRMVMAAQARGTGGGSASGYPCGDGNNSSGNNNSESKTAGDSQNTTRDSFDW